MNTHDTVREWLAEFGATWEGTVANGWLKPTCAKGCSACCSERLQTTREEAALIWATLSAERRAELTPAIRAWARRFEAAEEGLDNKGNKAVAYRRLNLVCPLLRDGLCSVYDVRPLGCRLHTAVGPRVRCEDLQQRPHQTFAVAEHAGVVAFLELARRLGNGTLEFADLAVWLAIFAGVVDEAQVTAE